MECATFSPPSQCRRSIPVPLDGVAQRWPAEEGQVERLVQVFEIVGKRAQGKTCPAIDGILEEGEEVMDEYEGAPALDAGLVGSAQAVEHYEICRYKGLKGWAMLLGMSDAAALLDQNLQEELATLDALTAFGEGGVNQRALEEVA